ncbi:GNAT family N-acetyltransferase [Mesorhizobium sp. B1-1-8]|uniref:GNAT family N-acetyltransferase n=1 Tax=Mesorhizobium sp. B1-1-8 TaxID=2589976 RepID=UPI00112D0D8A|nr:GNAT family N-acetyltransferase [Mesorhizobium sp. B1-1-8]UCI07136.1 GNAT family N-acetyltransferase [Mesorhizobium sp. B1-1-8]
MFKVTVEDSFDFRSTEYVELFTNSAATAFQHPIWLALLYEKIVRRGAATPLIIVVRDDASGKLAMVLPLVRSRYMRLKVVEFADMRVSDYVSPVTDEQTFSRILADGRTVAAIRKQLKPYDLLRIGKLGDRSLPLERLLGIDKRESMGMSAYSSKLEATFESWREHQLDRSYRKELDKKSRQLGRIGEARFECADNPDAIRTTFDALKLYRGKRFDGSDGPADLLQQPSYFEFYLAVATEGRSGFARTYTFWMNGKPIAGALGLAHRGSLLVILGGFDEAGYRKQSIGSLTFERIAADCIARGDHSLDFTIGDEPYKLIFGGRPSPMWQIFRAGSPLGYAAHLTVEKLPAAKALARRLFHASHGRPSAAAPMMAPSVTTDEAAGS